MCDLRDIARLPSLHLTSNSLKRLNVRCTSLPWFFRDFGDCCASLWSRMSNVAFSFLFIFLILSLIRSLIAASRHFLPLRFRRLVTEKENQTSGFKHSSVTLVSRSVQKMKSDIRTDFFLHFFFVSFREVLSFVWKPQVLSQTTWYFKYQLWGLVVHEVGVALDSWHGILVVGVFLLFCLLLPKRRRFLKWDPCIHTSLSSLDATPWLDIQFLTLFLCVRYLSCFSRHVFLSLFLSLHQFQSQLSTVGSARCYFYWL